MLNVDVERLVMQCPETLLNKKFDKIAEEIAQPGESVRNIIRMLMRCWRQRREALKFGATSAAYIQWQRKIFM